MLKQLLIRNFAVIDELELQLQPGMTVFTGETGAGKSILIDALGLVLGDRADSAIIRAGCESAEITASFEVTHNSDVLAVLEQLTITMEDNELLVRRVIKGDGKSRAYINSTPVPVNVLRSVGEHLIDIHGQHAHQSLMKRDAQRLLLDDYGAHKKELHAVTELYNEWQVLQDSISKLSDKSNDHSAHLSLIRYQVQELEELSPQIGEYEELSEEFKRLDNANRLIELAQSTTQSIKEDEHSITSTLSLVIKNLRDAHQFDGSLQEIIALLQSAEIQISEAGDELRMYLDKLDNDPEHLTMVEARLSNLHNMARKHNIHSNMLCEYLEELKSRLYEMEGSDKLLDEIYKRQEKCLQEYRLAARKLHILRDKVAKKVSAEVTITLASLGMPEGQFLVNIEEQSENEPSAYGNDLIDFLVSANPGLPPQVLKKVASGGELSRISLAIQVTSNNDKLIPILVFDEVDAGIGGGVAEIVGNLLHSLTDKHQVFCVTHLAQVASLADQHLQVHKTSSRKTTKTKVAKLDDAARIEEIARMLGGMTITEQSRKHAKEMLMN